MNSIGSLSQALAKYLGNKLKAYGKEVTFVTNAYHFIQMISREKVVEEL